MSVTDRQCHQTSPLSHSLICPRHCLPVPSNVTPLTQLDLSQTLSSSCACSVGMRLCLLVFRLVLACLYVVCKWRGSHGLSRTTNIYWMPFARTLVQHRAVICLMCALPSSGHPVDSKKQLVRASESDFSLTIRSF